jgi:hypothetical protein
MGVTIGGIGAAVSGGSALAGLLGLGGNSQPTAPTGYQFGSLPTADSGAISGTQNLGQYNTAGQSLPYAQQTFQNLYNNPYASSYQANANATGAAGMGAGANLVNAGQSYLPYAQQTLQTGFDPQQQLYNQQFQLNSDQTNANLAQRGLGTSPYGASVADTSNNLFNSNWQNQQLGRQATAASTANTLTGAANTGTTSGLNLMNAGGALPYSTANSIGGNQNTALQSYGAAGQSASALPQQQIADFLQYLSGGNAATSTANSIYASQLTGQNNQFNQMQTLGKNLGSSISGLGTAYNGGSGTSTNNGNFNYIPAPGGGYMLAAA